jgi:hypothetical protein
VPGGALLVAAYMAMWALAAGYLGWLALAQRRDAAELQRLQAQIEAAARTGR